MYCLVMGGDCYSRPSGRRCLKNRALKSAKILEHLLGSRLCLSPDFSISKAAGRDSHSLGKSQPGWLPPCSVSGFCDLERHSPFLDLLALLPRCWAAQWWDYFHVRLLELFFYSLQLIICFYLNKTYISFFSLYLIFFLFWKSIRLNRKVAK